MRLLRLAEWLEHGPLRYAVGVVGLVLFAAFWLFTFYLGAALFGALEFLIRWILSGGLA